MAECARLVRDVHQHDRYPVVLPDDPAAFLRVTDALGAWVTEDAEGCLVGHVLLRPATSAPVMNAVTRATGLGTGGVGVVGRLLVAPWARRRGIGRALLDVVVASAHRMGRRPVLDVVTTDLAAIALYESVGWQRVDTVTVTFGDLVVDEHVFLGPEAGPADLAPAGAAHQPE